MNSAPQPTSPLRPRPTASGPPGPVARRLVLVPAERRDDELVRRYRLARLRLEPRPARGPERFAHLTQRHD